MPTSLNSVMKIITAKPRLCFTLLYGDGNFYLSRNFNLQEVGDFDWLMENYEFESIRRSIDELVILNVSKHEFEWPGMLEDIRKVVKHCFMPIAIGGGIRNIDQAGLLFANGADKIVMNSAFFCDPKLVRSLVEFYGTQSIVASLDFRRDKTNGSLEIFLNGGSKSTGISLVEAIKNVVSMGAGELYLTSIVRDGTVMGYDLNAIEDAFNACDLPIIASGGADTSNRLSEGLRSGFVSAASTSHLFNFMCDGLQDARQELIADQITLSRWNFEGIDLSFLNTP